MTRRYRPRASARRAVWIAVCLLLPACTGGFERGGDRAAADLEALRAGGFVVVGGGVPEPPVVAFARTVRGPARDRAAPLVVYIEGDGRAWRSRTRPSADPSPDDPVALRLSLADPAPAVAYLGRPCQFLTALPPVCRPAVWTDQRYSRGVVDAMSARIDALKRHTASDRLVLVGYSGGGYLAIVLAVLRDDVAAVVTVAANLDPEEWARFHGVSPVELPLSQAELAAGLTAVAQTHLFGGRDRIVPFASVERFAARLPPSPAATVRIVPGYDHRCCWAGTWPGALVLSAVR